MSNVYLVVSNNKSYQCKSTHSSTPYIKVSNSYLDLASTTTKGTQIKFNINNKTYRPKQTYTTTASKSSQYNTTIGYIGVKSSSYNTTTSRTTGGYKLNTYDHTVYTDTTYTYTNTFTAGKGRYETYTLKYITDYTSNKTWTSSSIGYEHTDNYTESVAGNTTTKAYSYSQNVSELSYLSKINNSCIILSSYSSYSTTNTLLSTLDAMRANIYRFIGESYITYPATSTRDYDVSMSIAWNNRITISSADTIETNTTAWFTVQGIVISNINSKTYIRSRYCIMATHQQTYTTSGYYYTTGNYNNNGQGKVLFSTTQTTETGIYSKSSLTTSFTTNSVSVSTDVWVEKTTASKYSWNGIPATTVSTETNTTKTQNYTTTSNNINSMSSTTALTRTSSRQSNYNTNTEL